jgi:hypothetical protein
MLPMNLAILTQCNIDALQIVLSRITYPTLSSALCHFAALRSPAQFHRPRTGE